MSCKLVRTGIHDKLIILLFIYKWWTELISKEGPNHPQRAEEHPDASDVNGKDWELISSRKWHHNGMVTQDNIRSTFIRR